MTKTAIIMSRNDNYGGNLELRATYCLNSMVDPFDEVIYVDWNTRKDKKTLIDLIRPNLRKTGKIRAITITPDEAFKYVKKDPTAQPCCEVLGRNVAIRRATSDWIVSTNIDIVPPKTLNFSQLNKDTFHTVSRKLFMDTGMYVKEKPIDFFLDDSEDFFKKIPYKDTDTLRKEFSKLNLPHKQPRNDISLVDCCGDFQIAHKNLWYDIRGFEESMIYRGKTDTNVQLKSRGHGFNLKLLMPQDIEVIHIGHLSFGEDGGGKDVVARNPDFGPDKTKNPETWGFSNINFKEEII
jgi:hypothetical protein|tara:strand:+ start:6033 stop:6914 length:882 start_codon:yes stop_codon:yes gene_type:complete